MKYFCAIGVFCALSSLSVNASEIAGSLKGERLDWISASKESSSLVPSLWDISINLPPASQVVLGGPTDILERPITLRGSNGGEITVPITVEGMQYELSSNAKVENVTGGLSSSDAVQGKKLVKVTGQGVSNKIVTLKQTETPFTHYRPIIKAIDSVKWLKAFREIKATTGTYRGTVNVTVPYDYYREGIRIRNTLMLPLTVLVEYTPAILTSVILEGLGVIDPRYHGYPDTLVSGETEYTITATGIFPNGVLVGLRPITEAYYQLTPKKLPSSEAGIRYTVTCGSGCPSGNTQFILDGEPKITGSNRAKIAADSTGTQARAKITVSFKDKKLSELKNDTYVGRFVLIFEAGI